MSNPLTMMPVVSTAISFVSGLINKIDRAVNSSEHNFKKDLHAVLEAKIGKESADKIQDFLDTGKDQGLGDRLRALMTSGLIPPDMAPEIAQLASQNGVPQSSIDPNKLQEPMDEFEAAQTIGEEQARKLNLTQFFDAVTAGHAEKNLAYKDFRLQKLYPN